MRGKAGMFSRRASDEFFSNVSLLLHMDGSGSTFTDSSGTPKTITASGGATQSTTQSKWGGKSLYTGAAETDRLTLPSGTEFAFPDDFTIECWTYFTQSGGYQGIAASYTTADATGWVLVIETSGNFAFYGSSGSSWSLILTPSVAPTLNTWQHVAVSRSSGVARMYVNGTLAGEASNSDSIPSGDNLDVGNYEYFPGGLQSMKGYIDDLRITKGVARYTADFTPPSAAFPDS
jgi:hypothetical protein